MKTIMVATRRNYTPEQKAAYQRRVLRRRVHLNVSNMCELAARVESHVTRMGETFRATAPVIRSAGAVLRDNFKGLRMTSLGQETLDRLADGADEAERAMGGPSADLVFIDEMIHSINPDGSHQVGDLRVWSPDPRLGTRPPVDPALRELLETQVNEIPIEQQFPEGWTRR